MSDIVSFYIPGIKTFETDNESGKITLTDSKDAKSTIAIPRSKIVSAKRTYDTLVVGYEHNNTAMLLPGRSGIGTTGSNEEYAVSFEKRIKSSI